MPWKREHRTLLAWLNRSIGGAPSPAPAPAEGVLASALAERVLPILSTHPGLPGEVTQAASRAALATGVRNAVLLEATRRIAGACDEARVPLVLLKGIDLCERVYGNPSLRPMQDVDLLVPEPLRARAVEALSGVGFRPEEPLGSGTLRRSVVLSGPPPQRAHIHLHWHLANASYPLPYAARIDLEGFRARTLPWPGAPGQARVPSPEDLAVYLCEHLVKHCCEEWIFAVDLALALRRLPPDPVAFWRIARSWGVERICACALRIVEGFLPGLGAGDLLAASGGTPLTFLEHLFVRQVLAGRRGAGVNWLVYLAHCPTAGARARQIWRGIFPEPADLAALDPEAAARGIWHAYAMRVGKAIFRVLGR